jgi:hypothetical protein
MKFWTLLVVLKPLISKADNIACGAEALNKGGK